MISCSLVVHEDVEDLYKIFLSENMKSDRAECKISKKGDSLVFDITSTDAVSMKAFINSILKIVETFNKVKDIK